MWIGMGGIRVDVAFGWSLVKKGRMRLKNFLTAGHSCEIGLYDVEILWSFSALGRGITLEVGGGGGRSYQTAKG